MRVDVIDVWAQSPLTVSGVLHGMDGKKDEVPRPPRIILGVGSEQPLQFSLWYKH
jgi:hypothetical protein